MCGCFFASGRQRGPQRVTACEWLQIHYHRETKRSCCGDSEIALMDALCVLLIDWGIECHSVSVFHMLIMFYLDWLDRSLASNCTCFLSNDVLSVNIREIKLSFLPREEFNWTRWSQWLTPDRSSAMLQKSVAAGFKMRSGFALWVHSLLSRCQTFCASPGLLPVSAIYLLVVYQTSRSKSITYGFIFSRRLDKFVERTQIIHSSDCHWCVLNLAYEALV